MPDLTPFTPEEARQILDAFYRAFPNFETFVEAMKLKAWRNEFETHWNDSDPHLTRETNGSDESNPDAH
jgi:hypothetical protein